MRFTNEMGKNVKFVYYHSIRKTHKMAFMQPALTK